MKVRGRESMNRAEFMRQLESLLQSIPAAEREEALQYYNDYFDDAGDESEQDVIEALGNPARVAENIKHDLLESGYGEAPLKKAVASDRKLIEYGKAEAQAQTNPASSQELRTTDCPAQEIGGGDGGNNGTENGFHNGAGNETYSGAGAGTGSGAYSGAGAGTGSGAYSGAGAGTGSGAYNKAGAGISSGGGYAYAGSGGEPVNTGKAGRSGWPGWAVALLVVGLLFASPAICGLAGTLIGVLAAWFCLIISAGAVALALFIVFAVLITVGVMCMFTDPVSGVALVGGGLLCGGIGILFLMLAVAMAGIVTPAVFRGIGFLFGRRKNK